MCKVQHLKNVYHHGISSTKINKQIITTNNDTTTTMKQTMNNEEKKGDF